MSYDNHKQANNINSAAYIKHKFIVQYICISIMDVETDTHRDSQTHTEIARHTHTHARHTQIRYIIILILKHYTLLCQE